MRSESYLVFFLQVGNDQLGKDMKTTTMKHALDSTTYVRLRAEQWGADVTLLVAPSSLSGANNAVTPGKEDIEGVKIGYEMGWVIATVKRGDLGSYVSLHELGHTFGLPHNREEPSTQGFDTYRDYSWAPW